MDIRRNSIRWGGMQRNEYGHHCGGIVCWSAVVGFVGMVVLTTTTTVVSFW